MTSEVIASGAAQPPGSAGNRFRNGGRFERIDQFTQCEYPGRLLFVDVRAQARFRKAEQFDSRERVEPEIEFDIHRRVQRAGIRLCLAHQFSDDGAHVSAKPRMILDLRGGRGFRRYRLCLPAFHFILQDFKSLQLPGHRPGKGFIANSERMDPEVRSIGLSYSLSRR